MPDREFRVATETWPLEDFEIRAEGDGLTFRGYAAVFDSESDDLGGFREVIRPGAFARSLNAASKGKRTVKMFLNHNDNIVLGSTRRQTLRLTEDARGLLAEADLPDNEWGRPVADAVRRGDIDSMSFGFVVNKDIWSDDRKTRELIDAGLWEVSPVTAWPAYPATSASVRHLAEEIGEEEDALTAAVKTLFANDARLTVEQRDLLTRAINARTDLPLMSATLAERFKALEAKRPQPFVAA